MLRPPSSPRSGPRRFVTARGLSSWCGALRGRTYKPVPRPRRGCADNINTERVAFRHIARVEDIYSPRITTQLIARRNIANMASATTVFDFKPLDSMLTSSPPPPSSALSISPSLHSQLSSCASHSCSHCSAVHLKSTLHPSLFQRTCQHPTNPPQRKANPSRSPNTPAKSSSSLTRPPNAASHPNTGASSPYTKRSPPLTPANSRSSASHATSSAARSPAPTTRSLSSAS